MLAVSAKLLREGMFVIKLVDIRRYGEGQRTDVDHLRYVAGGLEKLEFR